MKTKLSRREFLRTAALTGAGLVAAACAPAALPAAPAATTAPAKPAAPAVKKPVTIQYMVWGGADRVQPTLDAFKKLYPDAASSINVEVLSPGNHDAEVYQALRLALSAGGKDVPDLVLMNYIGVGEFAMADQLKDISQPLSAYKDIVPGAKALSAYEGKVVGVPTLMKAKNWYYRKDLFEKAGLDLNAIKTLDDYMAAGKKYHQVHPKSFIMNIGPQPIHYWYFMILSHWEDVRVADKDGNYQVTKNPHFKDLFNWLKTWKTSGISFNTDDWSQDWQPAFADSTIGGDLVSNWMNSFLPKYAPDQKGLWGLALWPEFNRTGSEAGGSVVVIPKGAKNPDAAFEFASKMFLDPKGAVYNFQSGGNPGATKAGQDAIREITASMKTKPADMKDDDWKVAPVNFFGVDFMDPINKALEVLKVFPYDPKAQAELDILRKHCEAFIADKETLDQALAGAEGDMKAQLGNPYKL